MVTGQPVTNTDCLCMYASSGKWYADDCNGQRSYLCSVPSQDNEDSAVVPAYHSNEQCPLGFVQGQNPRDCYFFFVPGTATGTNYWFDGERYCASKGGRLASVKSASENTFIHNAAAACGNLTDYQMWLGASAGVLSSQWKWIDGTPLTYSNWADGICRQCPLCTLIRVPLGNPQNFSGTSICLYTQSMSWYSTECSTTLYDEGYVYARYGCWVAASG